MLRFAPVVYLLKNLFSLLLKVALGFLFLGGVLWTIAHFISIDEHRESILQRINGRSLFELHLGETKLVLVPHPGVSATSIELRQKGGSWIARGESGEFRVILRSIFTAEPGLRLSTPLAEVRLNPNQGAQWNSFWPKSRRTMPRTPKATPTPNAIAEKIEARSRELAGIPTPKPAPDLPPYLRPSPTPTPEPPSLLENVNFRGVDADEMVVSTLEHGAEKIVMRASNVAIDVTARGWKVRGRLREGSVAPVTELLPMCEGEEKSVGKGAIQFTLVCGAR